MIKEGLTLIWGENKKWLHIAITGMAIVCSATTNFWLFETGNGDVMRISGPPLTISLIMLLAVLDYRPRWFIVGLVGIFVQLLASWAALIFPIAWEYKLGLLLSALAANLIVIASSTFIFWVMDKISIKLDRLTHTETPTETSTP